MDLAVVVLPQPDSPTSDSVSPCARSNDTPSTAWTGGRGLLNQRRGALLARAAVDDYLWVDLQSDWTVIDPKQPVDETTAKLPLTHYPLA